MSHLIFLLLSMTLLIAGTGCVGHAAASAENHQLSTANQIPAEEPEKPAEEPEEEPYVRVIDPGGPMVALTFDDGPHEIYSDKILDILEQNHAVATFFEVGRSVAQYPAVVAREAELGCEIGSHSLAHKNLSKMSQDELLADLAAADAAFAAAGVPVPTLVRPPYGVVNKTVRTTTGRSLITWNIDTEDWRTKDAQKVIDYVEGLQNLDGSVVLMHSIHESSVQAAAVLVPWLQEQGYQLVTVTELMAYYHGELPQPNTLYGYTYFCGKRTGTPLALPEAPAETEVPAA